MTQEARAAAPPIYMDHHATTPVLPEVVEAMLPYFTRSFGNPSSSHSYGREAAAAVEAARGRIARLIGAESPEEIIFTCGATESDNLAVRGACAAAGKGRDHIVTCAIEHEAVLETCAALEADGIRTTVLPVDRSGLLDPGDVRRAITDRTVLVSVMMANNEIGTIEPLEEIGGICRERGVLLHSDAVQAAGRIPLDVRRMAVDMMSLTAHKAYGPKGIGALYVRRGVALSALMTGGGQERRLRSGTLNVPAIVGFGKAAEVAARDMDTAPAREAALRDRLWSGIRDAIDGIRLNGDSERRLPNNLNVAFRGVEAEALLTALRDVAALSSGSACASGDDKGSYVLRAIAGGPDDVWGARSSIRFGLGKSNDASQVDIVVERLARAVHRLRAMAPASGTSREKDGGTVLAQR